MKKVVNFILKAAAFVMVAGIMPLMLHVGLAIQAGDLTRGAALMGCATYLVVMVLVGLLADWGERK